MQTNTTQVNQSWAINTKWCASGAEFIYMMFSNDVIDKNLIVMNSIFTLKLCC